MDVLGFWGGAIYGIKVAVSFAHCVQRVHPVVGVQVEQEAFELGHLAILRPVDFGQSVDPCYPFFYRPQVFGRHAVAFVDYDHIRVGYLQVCSGRVHALMLCTVLPLNGFLVQAQKYILCIDEGDDTVQIYRTAQAVIDPEERGKIARVRETRCFQEDVIKGASPGHEGFDCVDTGVLDGAANAAIGQLEPFLRFLTVLGDCQGFLDIGSCVNRSGENGSGADGGGLTVTEFYFVLAMQWHGMGP